LGCPAPVVRKRKPKGRRCRFCGKKKKKNQEFGKLSLSLFENSKSKNFNKLIEKKWG